METRRPLRPGWPCIRVTSAGLGFPGAKPARSGLAARPAQRTDLIDGTQLATHSVRSA